MRAPILRRGGLPRWSGLAEVALRGGMLALCAGLLLLLSGLARLGGVS
jgi:hypothetical protein